MNSVDVAVIGGGPAGLAAALEATRLGLSVQVFEKQPRIPDKACGEGLMPEGARWLETRGVTPLLDASWTSPLAGIRYLEDGELLAEARFQSGPGIAVRRVALVEGLHKALALAGVRVQLGSGASVAGQGADCVHLSANETVLKATIVVAADGLHSPIRRQLGLEPEAMTVRRFGQRRHFQGVDLGDIVEVHWSNGVEAYLTPTGANRCGVCFLWEDRNARAHFEELLAGFPLLQERFSRVEPISEVRGAGPLAQPITATRFGRVVFIGDAAGYVDAITGEGISLAFASAMALGSVLPAVIDGDVRALDGYSQAHATLFRRYAIAARALVWLSRRPRLRRAAFSVMRRAPQIFEQALGLIADRSHGDPSPV